MAEVDENKTTEDSVIREQSLTIKTLSDRLAEGGAIKTPQVIYAPKETEKPPNYLLFIGIGLIGWFLLRR